jgi:hypothetical protein
MRLGIADDAGADLDLDKCFTLEPSLRSHYEPAVLKIRQDQGKR